MQIWAFILVGVQIVYDITMIVYRRFIMQLADMVLSSETDLADTMVDIYNNTHGFKYLGMFIGIMLGMIVTGVFLNDKLLKILAGVVSLIFVTAFVILEMEPISIMGHYVGIVWTSFIFHQMETVGLMLTAFYLSRKYRGI